MNVSRHQVSLGALAVVLCLAFPMGVLSLFSPATTGDQVDAADTIVVAWVEALQVLPERNQTVVEFSVDEHVAGQRTGGSARLLVDGLPAVEVGDRVVAMLGNDPDELLGVYHVQKDAQTAQLQVMTPVSGMWNQGVGDFPPQPLALFTSAIRVRRGVANPAVLAAGPAEPVEDLEGEDGPVEGEDILEAGAPPLADDFLEDDDTLATATTVVLNPPQLVTGNPLCITGLTLTSQDVDFFKFTAPPLSVLIAETRLPEGVTSVDAGDVNPDLDTLIGLWNADTAELLASDDDSGDGLLSQLVEPIQQLGDYAVAVESAPDSDLDFGFPNTEAATTGPYELKLELAKASYLTNFEQLVVGVSDDGTFIEDFVGFKEIGGDDALIAGVPGDGWGLTYGALVPGGITTINAGTDGDHLTDPGFTHGLQPGSFVLGPFIDANGYNRAGFAKASQFVPYNVVPRRGIRVTSEYDLGLTEETVAATFQFKIEATARIFDMTFVRTLDADLFGVGSDRFFSSFDPESPIQAFAVEATENVNTIATQLDPGGSGPALPDDSEGDYQMALVIDHGDILGTSGFQETLVYPGAFTLVSGYASAEQARDVAIANLQDEGMTTWVIATDDDPESGTFSAFGAGLGPLDG